MKDSASPWLAVNQMDSADYWRERAEQRLLQAEQKALQLERKLQPQFQLVFENIEAQIAKLYREFGTEEGLDYAEVNRKLTNAQKAQFRRDLEYYIQNNVDEDFQKKLKGLKLKARITRLEARKAGIEAEVHQLYAKYLNQELQLTLEDVLQDGYYRTIFDVQQFRGFGTSFTRLSPDILAALLEYPWSGKNYSEKLWGHVRDFSGKLNQVLTTGIIQGTSSQMMARQLAKAAKAEYSKALTLIRTETNYIANDAAARGYSACGVTSYKYLATLDLRTSELCRFMDGKVFSLEEKKVGINYPPLHPRCRSTTVPDFPELTGTRIARGRDGKTYQVPRDMTYSQWYKKYVEGNAADDIMKLSDRELGAINRYISAESYTINEKLRSGAALNQAEERFVKELDAALEKLPTYQGTVYRSIDSAFLDEEKFNRLHQINSVVVYDAYTSTALSVYDPGFKYQLKIVSKTGRDLTAYNATEQEVLFARGTSFVVMRREGNTIIMKEV